MSDYCRNLVLRYPLDDDQVDNIDEKLSTLAIGKHRKNGYFEVTGTVMYAHNYKSKYFLDYVVKSTYGEESSDFGKVRNIYDSEIEYFKRLFQLVIPDIDMNKVKIVDYCYYNCCEPEAYYDEQYDEFYKQLDAPVASWQAKEGVVTPGGDPFVVCSQCGGGGHLDGIESPNFLDVCPECGCKMIGYNYSAE